jgi:sugar phosphate isomerase/epimerase
MCWPVSKAERRYAGVTHVDVSDVTTVKADEVHRIMADAKVQISALGYYPNPLSRARGKRPAVVHASFRARHCSTQAVNTFIGRDWTKSVDNWPRSGIWKPLLQFAEGNGIPHRHRGRPMLFSRDEWPGGKNIITARSGGGCLPSDSANLGLNYDPSHMIWQHMDYLRPLREFKDRLFHVHAKDVRLDRERLDDVGILAHPNEYHTPKLPGLGDVNWGQFFSVLTDVGYRGPVCVEVEDRAYEDSLDARKASLKQSHAFLRNFIVD